jgi:ribosomal protein L37AE/L43A
MRRNTKLKSKPEPTAETKYSVEAEFMAEHKKTCRGKFGMTQDLVSFENWSCSKCAAEYTKGTNAPDKFTGKIYSSYFSGSLPVKRMVPAQ